MLFQFNSTLIPYLFALAITLPFVFNIFRLKPDQTLRITTFMLICSIIWVVSSIMELAVTSLPGKIIFYGIGYVALAFVPVAFFALSAKLIGLMRFIKKDVLIALSIIPVIDIIAEVTNHSILFVNDNLVLKANGAIGPTPHNFLQIITWVGTGYSWTLVFFIILFLIIVAAGRQKYFRRQALLLLFSLIIVLAFEIIYIFNVFPELLNIAPAALCICWVIYWIFGYRYFKLGEFIPVNYESIIDNINDCVIVLDKKGMINFVNNRANKLFSIGADYIGKPLDFYWPDYNHSPGTDIPRVEDIEIKVQGRKKYIELSESTIKKEKEKIGRLIILKDITERKMYEEKIKYMSFHDYLTGLYNRAFFDEELARLNVGRNLPLSIVLGDINGLKIINDAYGHDRGDELLIRIADILRECFRKSDIISRWGGDEFIILLPKTDYHTSEEIIERIEEACASSAIEDMPLSIALGIATKTDDDEDINDILNTAEERMYLKKMRDHLRSVPY